VLLAILLSLCLHPRAAFAGESAQEVTVKINNVVPDSQIVGRVLGLSADRAGSYKVVVYVKTDKWYIHPYVQGGEGLSFAKIDPDGSWRIKTVKREFPAELVTVLVVPKDSSPPAQTADMEGLKKAAIASYTEQGQGRL